jgi:branched-chain amino acid transport system substrate-binding protein
MFTVQLNQDGEAWVPELLDTVDADQVAPPEASGR